MEYAVIIAVIFIAVLLMVLYKFKAKNSAFTGGDYTITELDLSEMPKELKGTKYEYL